MVTMPKIQVEEQHDAMPGVSMLQYCGSIASRSRIPIPQPDHFEGTVKAELYRGLWIIRCPEDECSSAVAVTSMDPKCFCPDCGGGWYHVEFPTNKAAIVREVMKRPIPRRGLLHANWSPYGGRDRNGEPNWKPETMAQLRAETKARSNI